MTAFTKSEWRRALDTARRQAEALYEKRARTWRLVPEHAPVFWDTEEFKAGFLAHATAVRNEEFRSWLRQ